MNKGQIKRNKIVDFSFMIILSLKITICLVNEVVKQFTKYLF